MKKKKKDYFTAMAMGLTVLIFSIHIFLASFYLFFDGHLSSHSFCSYFWNHNEENKTF